MKFITRSALALAFLIGLAASLQAQAPNVSVRIGKPAEACFPVQLKNLRSAPVTINHAVMSVFDKDCRRVCISKTLINKRLDICKTLDFRICCREPLPSNYTCYVQVFHSSGKNEGWFFRP